MSEFTEQCQSAGSSVCTKDSYRRRSHKLRVIEFPRGLGWVGKQRAFFVLFSAESPRMLQWEHFWTVTQMQQAPSFSVSCGGVGGDSSHRVAPGLEELPLGARGSRDHLVKDWLAISASSAQKVHQEVMG